MSRDRIEQLLYKHTPRQIELGFEKLPSNLTPNEVADVVLKGRFGYRRGFKALLKPPKGIPPREEGGNASPTRTSERQKQDQELLLAYLEGNTKPPNTSSS